jgi:hypothetical protein
LTIQLRPKSNKIQAVIDIEVSPGYPRKKVSRLTRRTLSAGGALTFANQGFNPTQPQN